MTDTKIIELTADIVSAHVSNNSVTSSDVPALIRSVFDALTTATQPLLPEAEKPVPAVSIRASIRPDHLICLEDGKKLTMLKRYLRTNYDMSPDDYRAKWSLPRDYPMVAPDYAAKRRGLAHAIGLGRKKVTDDVTTVATTARQMASKAADLVEADVVQPVIEAAKAGRKKLGIFTAKAATVAQPGGEAAAQASVRTPIKPARKPGAKEIDVPAS
jgi:predicted transcriptional regulator